MSVAEPAGEHPTDATDATDGTLDFESGRLQGRPARLREHLLLIVALIACSIPYVWLFWGRPWLGLASVGALGAALGVIGFFRSTTQGGMAHTVRFLLAGSNPLSLSGGASLMLGGVDTLMDFGEDSAARRQQPLLYWLSVFAKLAASPLGAVLLILEFGWDLVLRWQSPRLLALKWEEFFRVARFHDVVCPEKSNDIFYPDLACARLANDPPLYQWHRLRALCFELQHSWRDVENQQGRPETNIFWQSELAAYQTLRRLDAEQLELQVTEHYASDPSLFPLRPQVAERLRKAARPILHYLRFRQQQSILPASEGMAELYSAAEQRFDDLLAEFQTGHEKVATWKVLRVLDCSEPLDEALSPYLEPSDWQLLQACGIVCSVRSDSVPHYSLTVAFRCKVEDWLAEHFERCPEEEEMEDRFGAKVPRGVDYRGEYYRAASSASTAVTLSGGVT